MRSPNCLVLLAVLVSPLLMACSNTTVTEEVQSSNDPKIEATATPNAEPSKGPFQPIRLAPQLINGWPADTPDLRDVIFNFEVTGDDPKRVLSEGDSGFLIIQSERTSEAAKLIFYDDKRAQYRLPAHQFRVHSIGSELICREVELLFSDTKIAENSELKVKINTHSSGAFMTINGDDFFEFGNCRTQLEWAKIDAKLEKSKSLSGKKVKLPSALA